MSNPITIRKQKVRRNSIKLRLCIFLVLILALYPNLALFFI